MFFTFFGAANKATSSNNNTGLITVENCQAMPRKTWHIQASQNSATTNNNDTKTSTNNNNSNYDSKNGLTTESFYSALLQLCQESLAKSLKSTDAAYSTPHSNSVPNFLELKKILDNSLQTKAISYNASEVIPSTMVPSDWPGKQAWCYLLGMLFGLV